MDGLTVTRYVLDEDLHGVDGLERYRSGSWSSGDHCRGCGGWDGRRERLSLEGDEVVRW